LPVPNMYRILY